MADSKPLLFVCTGNTCRSPMAEAIWKALGTDIPAYSAGISVWSGQPAHEHAIEAVIPYGGTLENHRSQDIRDVSIEPGKIMAMTAMQAAKVAELRPEWADRTWVFTEFLGESGDISDPLGRGQVAYDRLAMQLYQLLIKLKATLQSS